MNPRVSPIKVLPEEVSVISRSIHGITLLVSFDRRSGDILCGGDGQQLARARARIPPPPQPAKVIKTGYKITEIAKGTGSSVVDGVFTRHGSMLVTERVGRLRVIKDGSLQTEPIGGVPAVHTGGQAGLFDIVLTEFRRKIISSISLCRGNEGGKWYAMARAPSTGGSFQICT